MKTRSNRPHIVNPRGILATLVERYEQDAVVDALQAAYSRGRAYRRPVCWQRDVQTAERRVRAISCRPVVV